MQKSLAKLLAPKIQLLVNVVLKVKGGFSMSLLFNFEMKDMEEQSRKKENANFGSLVLAPKNCTRADKWHAD